MEFVKRNKGVIIFYLIIACATLIFVQNNNRSINMNNGYVYLSR